MPELPEVEVTRQNLQRWTQGRTFRSIEVRPSRMLRGAQENGRELPVEEAQRRLEALAGATVLGWARRGKWLRAEFVPRTAEDSAQRMLFVHLGMTGRFVRRSADAPLSPPEERHRQLALHLEPIHRSSPEPHEVIVLVDPRRFGRVLVATADFASWGSLGADPLVDGLDPALWSAKLGSRRHPIKDVLLDQTVLAGIGNIQATEALWHAGIDPQTPANQLDLATLKRLAAGLDWTLRRTLQAEAGTELVYLGDRAAPNPFVVYGRSGEPCPRCEQSLRHVVQSGRTTTYCATCQPRLVTQRKAQSKPRPPSV